MLYNTHNINDNKRLSFKLYITLIRDPLRNKPMALSFTSIQFFPFYQVNNITRHNLKQFLLTCFMNLQLPATCWSFLEPSSGCSPFFSFPFQPEDGSKKLQHVAGSCKFIKYLKNKRCVRLYCVTLFREHINTQRGCTVLKP